jgi:hypothetical protein
MFYVHEVRNCCVLAISERRRGRLGSKISGCGQLAEVAACFTMSGLPPEADINRKVRHVRWGPEADIAIGARLDAAAKAGASLMPAHRAMK